jgi:hypothetical protein
MVHLSIHLPNEALLRGPVHYGWMYPVERRLGYLKNTMHQKKYLEGSIAEGYIVDECLNYYCRYLSGDLETRFNKDERNHDNKRTVGPDEFQFFQMEQKDWGNHR